MKNYNEMTTAELRKIAQGMGIKGYASKGKAWLVPQIEAVEAERKAAEDKKPAKAKREAQKYEGKTLNEWSEELNIPVATLRGRIRRGWDINEALCSTSHKARGEKLYEFNGKSQNLRAWSKELGISADTLHGRINRLGWTPEKAFTTKPQERKEKQAAL